MTGGMKQPTAFRAFSGNAVSVSFQRTLNRRAS